MTDRITWLGHSTVVVEIDGMRVLTDPLLRRRVLLLRRDGPVESGGLDGLDAILISHLHYDHLDAASLRRLDRATTVIVPRGGGRILTRLGFATVVEVVEDEEVKLGNLTLRPVHAEHGSKRLLGAASQALGFIVSGSKTVYFLGDTDLFPGMSDLPRADVALVPIWGWGPRVGSGHLDPRRAAEALRRLRPGLALPIHWGTYYPVTSRPPSRAFLSTPVDDFLRAAAETVPDVAVLVLPVGGNVELDAAQRDSE
ncbi:MAG TPA: MBL fold metallo-hydrolase [Gaiellaceae bacterium]|nr:MBL fold metallo-hydrolase [Gaiellaceae bacterium]